MTRIVTLYRWRDRLYRIHVITGLAAAVWFLLMALTGILINHQESFGLADAEISNRYLPGHYRSDSLSETTRLNVLIADLHSGRILGTQGQWLSDLVGVLLIMSLLSGYLSNRMKKGLQAASSRQIARERVSGGRAESQWESSNSGQAGEQQVSKGAGEVNGRRVPAQ